MHAAVFSMHNTEVTHILIPKPNLTYTYFYSNAYTTR